METKKRNFISLDQIEFTTESLVTKPSKLFIGIYLLTVTVSIILSFVSIYYYI